MKPRTRIIIGLSLAGCAALLFTLLQTGSPDTLPAARKQKPVVMQPPVVGQSPAAKLLATQQPRHDEDEPLLPSPVLAAEPQAAPPIPWALLFKRPAGESMMSAWAARDPEGAGQWLNQNRNLPNFADMVRGYAIQIATIDPAVARQWAAQIPGQDRFNAGGGTLEQHIDAIETMLSRPATEYAAELANAHKSSATLQLPDYIPRLVRQHPGEDPVFEMEPVNPFI